MNLPFLRIHYPTWRTNEWRSYCVTKLTEKAMIWLPQRMQNKFRYFPQIYTLIEFFFSFKKNSFEIDTFKTLLYTTRSLLLHTATLTNGRVVVFVVFFFFTFHYIKVWITRCEYNPLIPGAPQPLVWFWGCCYVLLLWARWQATKPADFNRISDFSLNFWFDLIWCFCRLQFTYIQFFVAVLSCDFFRMF